VVDTFVYDSPFLFPVVDSLVPDSVMGESGKESLMLGVPVIIRNG
jgi:hypothetical protein